jgi:hypothetical protein
MAHHFSHYHPHLTHIQFAFHLYYKEKNKVKRKQLT